jgi:hypothetical protein
MDSRTEVMGISDERETELQNSAVLEFIIIGIIFSQENS